MFGLGVGEIIIILVIALVVIGPKKLPDLARTIGKGLGEFQNAMRGINNTVQHNPPQDQDQHGHDPHIEARPKKELYEDAQDHDPNYPEDEKEFLAQQAKEQAKKDEQN